MEAHERARRHRVGWLALPVCAALIGCGTTAAAGVSAEITLAPVGLQRAAAFETSSGDSLELDFAALTLLAVELVPCDSLARRAWNWLVPSALAHGLALPTRIATPTLQDGFATDETVLGSLTPPAGNYCNVRVSFGPADADAVGLREMPRMLDRTLSISGSVHTAHLLARPFTIESADAIEVSPALALTLDEKRRSAGVRVHCDTGAALAELDFAASPAELDQAFRTALARHIEVELDRR